MVRQAKYEDRKRQHQRDSDVVWSAQELRKDDAREDMEATPVTEQSRRLWYGCMPLWVSLSNGHFALLRMSETQLRRYAWCMKQPGCRGMWSDTLGGMVAPIDGHKVLHTLLLHDDPTMPAISRGSRTLILAEMVHTTRDYFGYKQGLDYMQREVARPPGLADTAWSVASRSLLPSFVVTDNDRALINAFSISLNGIT